MPKFRKKPIIVDAYQTDEIARIYTLEGTMVANPGDWVITDMKGRRYPCKPDIFELTYEPVEDIEEGDALVERIYDLLRELAVKLGKS